MADMFCTHATGLTLLKKKVILIGGSNMRAVYKDLISILQGSGLTEHKYLKNKGELSCLNDRLVKFSEKTNGRNYTEDREFSTDSNSTYVKYYFVSRIYSDIMNAEIIPDILTMGPDVVVLGSCLWDLTRWGPNGVDNFKENLLTLTDKLSRLLPEKTVVIWATTPPVDSHVIKGGFMLEELSFLKKTLSLDIMCANQYATLVMGQYGFDVLDWHYYLNREQIIAKRCSDGIHWSPSVVRYMTNLLLTHLCLAWGISLPNVIRTSELQRTTSNAFRNFTQEKSLAANDFQSYNGWVKLRCGSKRRISDVDWDQSRTPVNKRSRLALEDLSDWSIEDRSFDEIDRVIGLTQSPDNTEIKYGSFINYSSESSTDYDVFPVWFKSRLNSEPAGSRSSAQGLNFSVNRNDQLNGPLSDLFKVNVPKRRTARRFFNNNFRRRRRNGMHISDNRYV